VKVIEVIKTVERIGLKSEEQYCAGKLNFNGVSNIATGSENID